MEEEQADLASLKFGKELEESRCLNLCEVKLLLTDVLKSGKKRSSMAENLIKQSYDYACRFARVQGRMNVLNLRDTLEHHVTMKEIEIALLVNLQPRSVDEAKTLIPSLQRFSDDDVRTYLSDMESYRLGGS